MSYSRVVNSKTRTAGARATGRPVPRQQSGQGRPHQAGAAGAPLPPRTHYPPYEHETEQSLEPAPTTTTATAGERSLESHGTHYVLAPHSSKNTKLKSIAKREEEQYRDHKDRKRESVTQMLHQQRPTAVGGVSRRLEEVQKLREEQEKRQQRDAKFAAVRQREKREQYKQAERQKEEDKYQQIKQAQREKADRLKEKQAAQELVDMEEMRRKRLARFDT